MGKPLFLVSRPQTNDADCKPCLPRPKPIGTTCALLAVGVATFDLLWPLGVAIGALYSLVMAATLLSRDASVALKIGALCSALVLVGALLSPDSAVPDWIVFVNAAIFIVVIWVTALLVISRQRAACELEGKQGELESANRELSAQANQDGLTGIANRRAFDSRLAAAAIRASRANAPLSLLMIDVDQFKRYNDVAGHPAGDACLRVLADAIRGVTRRPDDLLARYGGEEFAVILPDTALAGALDRAAEVCRAVRDLRIDHPGLQHGASVTVSVGAYTAVAAASPAQLIEGADRMLYAAKVAGGDCVFGS